MEETQLKKFSIVMEGGGMRGLYTAGVIDVLMDHRRCIQPGIRIL